MARPSYSRLGAIGTLCDSSALSEESVVAQDIVITAPRLKAAIEAIIASGGSEPREADIVAGNLVEANLMGHDSHGVGMVPRYVESLLEGGLAVNEHPRINLDSGVLLHLDGRHGYGQVIGVEAMALGIERARKHGTCVMALANAHHLGRIGRFAEVAVAEGLVSIHFVNVTSLPRVAPFGGSDARFGTNPCCIGVPLVGEPPMLLDFATSAVAQGKLRVAYNKGEKLPAGRLLDDKGRATDDPRYAVVPPFGAMLPFGEHKGYGLAVACELLGGALTGGGTWHSPQTSRRRVWNSMLTILIDAAKLGTADAFASEAREFVAWLRKSPPAEGCDRVRLAGEPEREKRALREREGIPLDATTWKEILAAGEKVKVPAEKIERLALR
jgi:uncharacterized oxidoreductase